MSFGRAPGRRAFRELRGAWDRLAGSGHRRRPGLQGAPIGADPLVGFISLIQEGRDRVADRSVSIVDVAREAGVSLGTVSNVLNRPERVSPATLERVQQAITALGFVRNELARQLRAGRSRSIGMIVLDVANPFFTDMAVGVEEAASEAGLSVLLCTSNEVAERETHYLSLLEEQRVYGVLVTPVTQNSAQMKAMRKRGVPVVLVDRGSGARQCSVSVDDVAGGLLAVRHLLDRGHRRIAVIGGPRSLNQVSDRLTGARTALSEAGVDPERLVVIDTEALNVAGGRSAGQRLLDLPARSRPTAAFCINDLLALGLLQAMTGRGVRVPDDLAIIGYDDIDFAAAAAVPLTSVRQPRMQLGRAATDLLIDEAEHPDTHSHRQVVFNPELVERASTEAAVGGTSRRRPARRAAAVSA